MDKCASLSSFSNVSSCAIGILNALIPIIMAVTVVWIIWSSFNLTKSEGEDRKKWSQAILYGIIGLFVMLSIWGLVNILVGTAGLNTNIPTNEIPNLNQLPTR